MEDCRYAERAGTPEYLFVAPTLQQAAGGESFYFHARPEPGAKIRLTSWRYSRDYLGRSYKLLGTVQGADGPYHRWLTDDCRLLYSPVEAGLPAPPDDAPGR